MSEEKSWMDGWCQIDAERGDGDETGARFGTVV